MQVSESIILSEIRKALQENGYLVIRHQQSMGSYKGFSDLTAIRDGITYYIECKTAKGKQSHFQIAFQRKIEEYGAQYILARSTKDIAFLCDRVQSLF